MMHIYKIDERRKRVASLLARSMTETQIAQALGVDQSTISRDIRALKEMSQRFVYDLAKSDLGYYYKQSIDGIGEAKREAWKIFNDPYGWIKISILSISGQLFKFRILAI